MPTEHVSALPRTPQAPGPCRIFNPQAHHVSTPQGPLKRQNPTEVKLAPCKPGAAHTRSPTETAPAPPRLIKGRPPCPGKRATATAALVGHKEATASPPAAPSPVTRAARAPVGCFRRRPTCQQGLSPGKAGQRRRRFQSSCQSYPKPPIPSARALRVPPGQPAALTERPGAQALLGRLLSQTLTRHRGSLATETSLSQPGTEAGQSSPQPRASPALKASAVRRVES